MNSITKVRCPGGCYNVNNTVIGTNVYHPNSAICRAALHAGKINNLNGGKILILP